MPLHRVSRISDYLSEMPHISDRFSDNRIGDESPGDTTSGVVARHGRAEWRRVSDKRISPSREASGPGSENVTNGCRDQRPWPPAGAPPSLGAVVVTMVMIRISDGSYQ